MTDSWARPAVTYTSACLGISLSFNYRRIMPQLLQNRFSKVSVPLLGRFGDDVGVGVSSCVRSPAAAAMDAARELCCMLASHSKRSTFSPCKPKWSLTYITIWRCHSAETIFPRKPTTNVYQGLLLPVLAAWEWGSGGCARWRTLGAAVAHPQAQRCSIAQPRVEPCYHVC